MYCFQYLVPDLPKSLSRYERVTALYRYGLGHLVQFRWNVAHAPADVALHSLCWVDLLLVVPVALADHRVLEILCE